MRFLLSSLLSLLFLFVCCANALSRQQFYQGRSANVQFRPNQPSDLFCVLRDPSAHYFSRSSSVSDDMSIVNVFDGAGSAMGVSPLNQDQHFALNTDFVHAEVFDRPRANIFTGVSSVGKNNVKKEVMPHLYQMINDKDSSNSLSFSLKDAEASVVSPPLSTVASIASASQVNAHGIVNQIWKGKHGDRVSAYSSADASSWSHRATFADVLSQSFSGKSMTLSFSSDPQLAAAFGVNMALQADHPTWNNFIISFDSSANAFTSSSSSSFSGAFHRSLSSLKADIFSSSSFLHQLSISNELFTYELDAENSKVKISQGQTAVVFNLSNGKDLLFFAELQYIHSLPELLHSSQQLTDLVLDSFPDALAINIGSTNAFANSVHGSNQKFEFSLMLLDAALPSFLHRLYALYPNRAIGELVGLGSPAQVQLDNENAFAGSIVPFAQFDAQWEQYFPMFYTSTILSEDSCEQLNKAMQQFGLDAKCMQTTQTQQFHEQSADNRAFFESQSTVHVVNGVFNSTGNLTYVFIPTYYPSEGGIEKFQIVLWVCVLLAVVLAGVIYSSAYMSFKKDTMLYSTFNPRWEDKKHR